MRQTNHNGRVNAKTGKAYSRKHNDRQYDITKAENIIPSMMYQNIILHFDRSNSLTIIDSTDKTRKTIDEHEHELYQELFGASLDAQHKRNEAARHPERNKSIDDLLEGKNTCPEETIFQIGSVEDGFPSSNVLTSIFADYTSEVIKRYGHNIHFLDAVLHLDEAVPHYHVRKVWTYDGKDGLDISQNKALEQMGFERPDPDKEPGKWNNAKITFSEWERNLKLELCKKYGLCIENEPKYPGKRSLTKEEAISVKLQEKNREARNELALTEQALESVSSELVTEEMKNKEIVEKNIFGRTKKIEVTPDEYRMWQKSAETKEHNEKVLQSISKKEKELSYRESVVEKQEKYLEARELKLENKIRYANSEISALVSSGIEKALPAEIKKREEQLDQKSAELYSREKKLDITAKQQYEYQICLDSRSRKLDEREKNINEEIKRSVGELIKDALHKFITEFKGLFRKRFKEMQQEKVFSVICEMPVDSATADRLSEYGYRNTLGLTVGELLDQAEAEDIKEALHEAGAGQGLIGDSDNKNTRNGISCGIGEEEIIKVVTEQVSEHIVRRRGR